MLQKSFNSKKVAAVTLINLWNIFVVYHFKIKLKVIIFITWVFTKVIGGTDLKVYLLYI